MSNTALMQRMLDAGVNISNMQEVFEFFHNQASGGGSGLTEQDVKELINSALSIAMAGLATSASLHVLEQQAEVMQRSINDRAMQSDLLLAMQALNLKASQTALDQLNANKASKSEVEAMHAVMATNDSLIQLDSIKANKADIELQLNEKLNRSEFHQHYRGLFSSEDLLQSGVSNPIAGDYATVDAGVGFPAAIYAYDADDEIWREQGSSGLTVSSTDSVPEGNSNLYFTAARAAAAIRSLSTTDLPEGQNLYHTAPRVAAVVRSMNTNDLPEGANHLYYTNERVLSVINPILGDISTALAEILG